MVCLVLSLYAHISTAKKKQLTYQNIIVVLKLILVKYENHVIYKNWFACWCPYNHVLVAIEISSCILYPNFLFQMMWLMIFFQTKYNFETYANP